jgi:hypothetical protein
MGKKGRHNVKKPKGFGKKLPVVGQVTKKIN